ncbi:uncharacterized protein PpBr36_09539, partial [Pyricularia pennisetigena]|uniref:uncharacterized protein n=1 Tax=Pyricularia pennisetigena TaxID=1578925 RepID=UPI0011510CDF
SPTIHNPPLPADGPGNESFFNGLLTSLRVRVPTCLVWQLDGGFKIAVFLGLITLLPILIVFWTNASSSSPCMNNRSPAPRFSSETLHHFLQGGGSGQVPRKKQGSHENLYAQILDGDADINGEYFKPDEATLDIGRAWGTLSKFPSVNYRAQVTGITLGRNQTK